MLQNGLGALFLAGTLSLPVTTPFEPEPTTQSAAPDSFLATPPDLKSEFFSPSWVCPVLSLFSLAGLYGLQRSAQERRQRHDAVKTEVAERFAKVGATPEALVHDESLNCGTLGWSHGHSIQTIAQAKQAFSSYMEFEKIQFYLESLPQSANAKPWAREALKIRTNLLGKILTYLDHCRADFQDSMTLNRRSARHFLLYYSAYDKFLKMIFTAKSPITGDSIGLSQKARDILLMAHKHYGRLVSAELA